MSDDESGLEFLRWWLTLPRDERRKVPGVYGTLPDQYRPNLDAWRDEPEAAGGGEEAGR